MDLRNPGRSWRPTCSWCWAQTTPTAPPTACGWSPRHRTSCWRSPPAAPAARTRSASARCTAPWAYGSTGNSTRRTTTWSRRCRGWSSSKASIAAPPRGPGQQARAVPLPGRTGVLAAAAGAGERSPRTGTAAHRTRATLSRSADRGGPVEPWRNRRRAAARRASATARRAGAARSGVTPCAGSRSPSAGGSSPTGRGGARGGARGPAAPSPRQRLQRRPLTSVRDHFRNRLTALTNGKTLHGRRAVSALGGTISRRTRGRAVDPSRQGLNMSIPLSIGPGRGPWARKSERIRMSTRRSDSGAAVSRLTLTTHLRPAGRVQPPLRTPASHAMTPCFLHQGLHLQPEPPPAATGAALRPPVRTSARGGVDPMDTTC